jgi:uncharacterized protein YdaU (DUF1376 family)
MSQRDKPLWVAWWPKDAIDGMAALSVIEECAYRRILDFIFSTGDQLLDDDRALAWMTKAGRAWPRVKQRLLDLGKIEVVEGRITNERARAACIESASFTAQKVEAARARWGRAKSQENNKTTDAGAYATAMPAHVRSDMSNQQSQNKTPSPSKNEGEGEGKSPTGDPPAPAPDPGQDPPPEDSEGKVKVQPPHPPMSVLEDMAGVWNEAAAEHGLAQVREITEQRAIHLRARCKERWTTDPVRQFRAYVTRICASPFLRGENDRGWKADFDWAVKPGNVVKVAEGKFHDGEAGEG